MRLGKREVDALPCPPDRREILVFDAELPGFGLRVTAGGSRTFILQYQLGGQVGRRVRLVLGKYGDLTPHQARKLAEAARGQVRAGRDPKLTRDQQIATDAAAVREEEQRVATAAFTVAHLLDQWAETALARSSLKHRLEATRAIRKDLGRLLAQPAQAVEAEAAQAVIDAIGRRSASMARRTRDYARSMYNWAMRRRKVAANPFDKIEIETKEKSRDRALDDRQLGEAWRAAGTLGYPYGPFYRLLILTLQRRGEVAGMCWNELAEDLSVWTVPAERAKNRKEHLVHLPEVARAILRDIPRLEACSLVFRSDRTGSRSSAVTVCSDFRPSGSHYKSPTDTGDASWRPIPLSGFSDARERLARAIMRERTGAQAGQQEAPPLDWRVHDFRRTGVSKLAELGIAPHVADRLLNHVTGTIRGVAKVYTPLRPGPENPWVR